jgi:hypothetical protein
VKIFPIKNGIAGHIFGNPTHLRNVKVKKNIYLLTYMALQPRLGQGRIGEDLAIHDPDDIWAVDC